MLKPSINKLLLISGLFLSFCFQAQAGKEDFKLPIKVGAKSQFVDGILKTAHYKDDVKVTQGSLNIDADELLINAEAGQGKEVFIATGNPAIYSQTLDDGNQITAKANEIRYTVATRTLDLKGNAELVQDSSLVQGEFLSYNVEKEQLLANGGGNNERVTTVFQPEDRNK